MSVDQLKRKIAEIENKLLKAEIEEMRNKLMQLGAKVDKATISTQPAELPKVNSLFCDQAELDRRTAELINSITSEFDRINTITRGNIKLNTKILNDALWVTFEKNNRAGSIRVPIPKVNNKNLIILKNKDVIRTVCDFWLESSQERLNYHQVMTKLFCEDVHVIMPLLESGSPLLHKIVKSFGNEYLSFMVSSLQRLIDDIMIRMPLYETDMNGWAMNHRLMVIDYEFETIRNPDAALQYQVDKNTKYYKQFGWTSIGLSDGVLADKNYLLMTDLRNLTPFGLYHNPQRNLYSTLGMTGNELPRIRSKSMQDLMNKDITRKGWNMITAIVDVPMNFEDQILVSKRHLSLSHKKERRFIVYGNRLRVKVGESVKYESILGFSNDGQPVRMNLRCDNAKVTRIRKDIVDLNGAKTPILVITVQGQRFFRDGTKFSNLHGNKGICRFVDLGYAIDPRTGEEVPIDVMISATSINKRKNFGQILEALFNNLNPGNEPIVIEDNFQTEKEILGNDL